MPTKRTPHSRRSPLPPRAFDRSSGRRSHGGRGAHARGGQRSCVAAHTIESVGGAASATPTKRRTARSQALDKTLVSIPTQHGPFDLSRRHFLIGAAGVAAVAAVGAGGSFIADQLKSRDDIDVLDVPEEAVSVSNDFAEVDVDANMALVGSFELPYGTMVWANSDSVAVCLVPGETSSPLSTVQLLWLGSGVTSTVLETAIGQDEGFCIYDARGTESGLVWVEADILEGTWRVYTAKLADGMLQDAVVADERSVADWETPQVAAVGEKAYWQVLPQTDGEHRADASELRACTMGGSDAHTVFESNGRMCTPPYPTESGIVITPRANASGVYYQLTYIDSDSESVMDTMTLPASMRPLEAAYGATGFAFSFDAIYNYGGGIAQLGTYTPLVDTREGDYSAAPWFRYARTPTAPPAWCGKFFVVKATSYVVCVDLATKSYCGLGVENGAEDYGDYLATTGTHNVIVSYSNIDNDPIEGEARTCCLVRVWSPV